MPSGGQQTGMLATVLHGCQCWVHVAMAPNAEYMLPWLPMLSTCCHGSQCWVHAAMAPNAECMLLWLPMLSTCCHSSQWRYTFAMAPNCDRYSHGSQSWRTYSHGSHWWLIHVAMAPSADMLPLLQMMTYMLPWLPMLTHLLCLFWEIEKSNKISRTWNDWRIFL